MTGWLLTVLFLSFDVIFSGKYEQKYENVLLCFTLNYLSTLRGIVVIWARNERTGVLISNDCTIILISAYTEMPRANQPTAVWRGGSGRRHFYRIDITY